MENTELDQLLSSPTSPAEKLPPSLIKTSQANIWRIRTLISYHPLLLHHPWSFLPSLIKKFLLKVGRRWSLGMSRTLLLRLWQSSLSYGCIATQEMDHSVRTVRRPEALKKSQSVAEDQTYQTRRTLLWATTSLVPLMMS